ncbi:hypothetical protein AN958_10041, partial [Leucoagaricus sp. SymC.cos]
QDDNAAMWLFSADNIKSYCNSKHHGQLIAIIEYPFIFGDAIDGYQSQTMMHKKHLLSLLQLCYFIDAWLAFLSSANYPPSIHTISCDALDIASIIVDGYISLLFIFRDSLKETEPLMPWLHSTEACEHVFGSIHQIVPDFSYLDFLYMVSKLCIKICEENL